MIKSSLVFLMLTLTGLSYGSDISCLGELEDGFNLNWCEAQKAAEYTTCEEAVLKGAQSYFNMTSTFATDIEVIDVVQEDAEYVIGYGVGPFEVLYTKTVLVSNSPQTCFAVEINLIIRLGFFDILDFLEKKPFHDLA